ncbi:MAG TPA: phosphodiester glycosidase family protein [Chitinophagaceae bacterium]|jgi:uncharacterized protein YigE (DUF2233 family)|nr:phosphodiester glycosidase family protein [Chitinophagaceae bacterium]
MRFFPSLALLLYSCTDPAPKKPLLQSRPPVADSVAAPIVPVQTPDSFASIRVDPRKSRIGFYWKDASGQLLRNLSTLRDTLAARGHQILFAMNGGMYTEDLSPLGLYIENGKMMRPVNRRNGAYGNFYIPPGGIFFIREDGRAGIATRDAFRPAGVRYATQSGPMVLVQGKINTRLSPASLNRNIRNGVGILPSGEIVLAISTQPVTFYEFARYFRDQGCTDALFLDGGISAAYAPAQNLEPWYEGGFGVMIAVTAD